jgi:micrococcal nuclease
VRHALVLLTLIAGGCAAPEPPAPQRQPVELVRVVDGDTIRVIVDGREQRVRYIGIDTPERGVPGFDAATEANRELLRRGRLRLEFDLDRHDPYDRLLAYVYAGKTFVNLELVRRGHACPEWYSPNFRHRTKIDAAADRRCP